MWIRSIFMPIHAPAYLHVCECKLGADASQKESSCKKKCLPKKDLRPYFLHIFDTSPYKIRRVVFISNCPLPETNITEVPTPGVLRVRRQPGPLRVRLTHIFFQPNPCSTHKLEVFGQDPTSPKKDLAKANPIPQDPCMTWNIYLYFTIKESTKFMEVNIPVPWILWVLYSTFM